MGMTEKGRVCYQQWRGHATHRLFRTQHVVTSAFLAGAAAIAAAASPVASSLASATPSVARTSPLVAGALGQRYSGTLTSTGRTSDIAAVASPVVSYQPAASSTTPATGVLTAASNTTSTTSTTSTSGTTSNTVLAAVGSGESNQQLAGEGYGMAVIPLAWALIEPQPGQFSSTAIQQVQSEIYQANAAGLDATIDIGTQYAPSWVFSVGGGTRFVDQYGDAFGGDPASGNDVANAVTDMAVRAQMGSYLTYLGSHLSNVAAVRVGGGPYNELRYPSGWSGSQANAFWFYDASSQALLPAALRGWRPGTGTTAQAAAFLGYYNAAMDQYAGWLVTQAGGDFPASKIELLLPGWGQRPGETKLAADSLLSVTGDEVNQGLDWLDLIPNLPAVGRVVAYTTWGDAPSGGPTNPAPAQFIHSLLPAGVLGGGETTGNGNSTTAGAAVMFQEAKQWHWYSAGWFFPGQPQSSADISSLFNAS